MIDLKNQAVWITGAGSGIGRGIAIAFAAAGCRLAISGRSEPALAETARLAGGAVTVVPADVTIEAQVARAHQAVLAAIGEPDILINNAGANAKRRHWGQLSTADMDAVVNVNLKGPFLCTLAVLPGMRTRRAGTIMHVASLAGTGIFAVTGPTYTATKHAVRALSATLNAEEGIHGIRSICINPGEVATAILDSRPRPPSAQERAIMVQPEDIAAACVFAAQLPARTCMAEMTIVPTDNQFYREAAHAIAKQS